MIFTTDITVIINFAGNFMLFHNSRNTFTYIMFTKALCDKYCSYSTHFTHEELQS